MKQKLLLAALALLLVSPTTKSYAYDFSAVAPSGQTLFYNINGNNVAVTCQTQYNVSPYYYNSSKPVGNLVIPSIVEHNGINYLVTAIEYNAFCECGELVSVSIPNSVCSIGNHAFEGCSNLVSVNIPSDVSIIENGVFRNCSSLESIIIPDSVTSIGCNAFEECSNLTSVIIPNSVTTINEYAFWFCNNIVSVTFGTGLVTIGDFAFSDCISLSSVVIPNNVATIGEVAFGQCTSLVTVSIGNGVTSIGEAAFNGCTGLTSIIIPDNVTSIKRNTFYGCSSLNSVTIPEGVTTIGKYAFSYCSNLQLINIPQSVRKIEYAAFKGCSGLISITIPDSVEIIQSLAFCDCTELTTINFYAKNCTSMSGSEYAEYDVFIGCDNLRYLNIGNNVKTIPNHGFRNCDGLSSVIFPDSVTEIGSNAFYGCHGLTAISLGSGIVSIGYGAFYDCDQLENVVTHAIVPPFVDENTFFGLPSNSILSVPCSTSTIYSDASVWNNFSRIEEDCQNDYAIITILCDNELMGFGIGGGVYHEGDEIILSAIPYEGYHFERWQDGDTQNPRTVTVTADATYIAHFAADSTPEPPDNPDDPEGIDDVVADGIRIHAAAGRIVVEGAEGMEVRVYDITGRLVNGERRGQNGELAVAVPSAGVYVVRVGEVPGRKVVVSGE